MKHAMGLSSFLTVMLLTTALVTSLPRVEASTGPTIWSSDTLLTIDPSFTYYDPEAKRDITYYYTPRDQFPSVFATKDGVLLAWQSEVPPENPHSKYEIFYRLFNGNWNNATQTTDDPNYNNKTPAVLQTSDNKLWIFWVSDKTENQEVFYKTTSNNGASWSYETQITNDPRRDSNPAVFEAKNGTVWLAWSRQINATSESVYFKTFNGTAWSQDNRLTQSNAIDQLSSIMQARDGKIFLFWCRTTSTYTHVFYETYNGLTWSNEYQLTDDARTNIDPTAFTERDGTMWLFWASKTKQTNADFDLWYKTSSNNGSTWTSSQQFTTDISDDYQPTATQAMDGTFWVIWTSNRDNPIPDANPNVDLWCRFSVPGDVDRDGVISTNDLFVISKAMPTNPTWPHGTDWNQWNPECEISGDDEINVKDLAIAAKNYGLGAS